MNIVIKAKERLLAMAFDRKECEHRITALSSPILDHILKVLIFKDDVDYHKHIDDINQWLFCVYEITPSRFKLKQRNYYDWLWGEKKYAHSMKSFEAKVSMLEKQYPLPRRVDNLEVYALLPLIYQYIAKQLALDEVPIFTDPILSS